MNYYNEFDPFAAEWLKALIKQGLIPDGEVDTRSIVDVRPDDLRPFKQCHFFAGIGGWSHALRLAGWADDRQIWTGSCPCQPFSVAGKGKGQSDERHLWPAFFELIRQVRPPVVMGEQVAGKAGYGWFDGVASDLEGEGYASRAVDIPACAVNAPHIRQRLYWVASLADARDHEPKKRESNDCIDKQWQAQRRWKQFSAWIGTGSGDFERVHSERNDRHPASAEDSGDGGAVGNPYRSERQTRNILAVRAETRPKCFAQSGLQHGAVGNTDGSGQREHGGAVAVLQEQPGVECSGRDAYPMADPDQSQRGWWAEYGERFAYGETSGREQGDSITSGRGRAGFWDDAEWATGSDGKARRIPRSFEPNICLLDDGFWYRMDDVSAEIAKQALIEVINYASKTGNDAGKILSLVWVNIQQEAVSCDKKASLGKDGRQSRLRAAEVLFDIMRNLLPASKQPSENGSCFTEENKIPQGNYVRDLQLCIKDICSSLRRKSNEQFTGKPSDTLSALSQFLAQCCEKVWEISSRKDATSLLIAGMKGRVGALRGLGNAIVPPLAAEVIRAFMETEG